MTRRTCVNLLLCLATGLSFRPGTAVAAADSWTGAALDHLWSDAGNWSLGAPVSGEDLFFGSGMASVLATNDFPAGMTFGNIGINVAGFGYTLLAGNPIVLNNGFSISGRATSPAAFVALDVTNGSSSVWTATHPVQFTGTVFLLTNDVYLNNAASMTFSSTVITTGGFQSGFFVPPGCLYSTNSGTIFIPSGATLTRTNISPFGVDSGGICMRNGTLQLDGAATNGGTTTIDVDYPGRLTGTGVVDQIIVGEFIDSWITAPGATISPGDSSAPGILHCGTARLASGDRTLSFGGKLHIEIVGTTPGTGYSQLAISTQCFLRNGIATTGDCSGATILEVRLSYAPQLGDSFQIISGTTSGCFYNLPYNSVFDITNGYSFGVSYGAGYTNGVTLTMLLGPSSPFALWKGSANLSDRLWSSSDNWAQGVVPTSGSRAQFTPYQFRAIGGPSCSILFPALPLTNDLAPGTSLASLLFTDTNYAIYGNPLTLTEGITNSSPGTNSLFIDLVPTGPLTLESDTGGTLLLSGGFDGSGTLYKQGGGDLRYVGNTMNSFVGSFVVNAGTLHVDGSFTDGSFMVNGGLLGGTGTVSTVTMNGGTLNAGDSPGIFHIQGNLTMTNGSVFQAMLNGPVPGTGYSQLQVSGTVALNGAMLNLLPGFNAAPGTAFLILINQGGNPIVGTFARLPEGAVFSAAGQYFSISYKGGSSTNNVLLTRLNPPGNLSAITELNPATAQLQGTGGSNVAYTIQANTNLATTNWQSIGAATAGVSGTFLFNVTNVPSFPQRFFRVQPP